MVRYKVQVAHVPLHARRTSKVPRDLHARRHPRAKAAAHQGLLAAYSMVNATAATNHSCLDHPAPFHGNNRTCAEAAGFCSSRFHGAKVRERCPQTCGACGPSVATCATGDLPHLVGNKSNGQPMVEDCADLDSRGLPMDRYCALHPALLRGCPWRCGKCGKPPPAPPIDWSSPAACLQRGQPGCARWPRCVLSTSPFQPAGVLDALCTLSVRVRGVPTCGV